MFRRLQGLGFDRLAATPSSALGSSRDKPDEAYCRRIFEITFLDVFDFDAVVFGAIEHPMRIVDE